MSADWRKAVLFIADVCFDVSQDYADADAFEYLSGKLAEALDATPEVHEVFEPLDDEWYIIEFPELDGMYPASHGPTYAQWYGSSFSVVGISAEVDTYTVLTRAPPPKEILKASK